MYIIALKSIVQEKGNKVLP